MTSQLNVDTIVDKAGSGGTNVKIGNTSTYVSDGGGATQNTVQGVAKFWAGELSHANDTAEDTFNNSSFTNVGTGRIGCNFTNNMSNNDCSVTYSCSGNYPYQGLMNGTTQVQHLTVNSANSFADGNGGLAIHGDLA